MAISNIKRAQMDNTIYCTITSRHFKWLNFTLQKNHIHGWSPFIKQKNYTGHFVAHRVTDEYILIYAAKLYNSEPIFDGVKKPIIVDSDYVWEMRKIHKNSRTGRAIMACYGKRSADIEWNTAEQVRSFYHPRLTANYNYMPMDNMRIPGGAYEQKTRQDAKEKKG